MRYLLFLGLLSVLASAPEAQSPASGETHAHTTGTDSLRSSLPAYDEDRFVAAPLFTADAYRLVGFAFREGQVLQSHSTPVDAYFLVTEGRARVTIGDEVLELGAGEGVVLPADILHAVEALADTRAVLSC